MKPIKEQLILVTGATDGIGKLTAMHLSRMGAGVLLHGRTPEKCRKTRDEIYAATANRRIECYSADLSNLSAVRQLSAELKRDHEKLHVLINNAGIGPGHSPEKKRMLSADGHELTMAVNYLAPFLLTLELLPLLRSAAPARIVNVTSGAQRPLAFDDLMLKKDYTPMRAYARSKLALAMFTFELADRLAAEMITVNCLHPGSLLDTKMVRLAFSAPQGSADSGAEVEVHVATAPELSGVTGTYFDTLKPSRADAQAYDQAARARLWDLSEELVGVVRPFTS